MLLSRDPTVNDLERNHRFITWDPSNTKFLRMDLEQSLCTLDPMAKGDMGIMHLIEEPLRRLIIGTMRHELDPP